MKQIVVISGKGGTGKTSVVSSLAAVGPKMVLADCDVDAADLHLVLQPEILNTNEFWSGEEAEINPDVCTQCGICAENCRFDAISQDFNVIGESCEGCAVCFHICPVQAVQMVPKLRGHWYHSKTRFGHMIHADLGIGEENSGKLVTTVRKESQELAEKQNIDMVLVDGSPGIGCPVIASLTNADMALIVAEPTMSAVHDMKRVYELTKHFKIKSGVIVNKSDINPDQVKAILDFCQEHSIPVVGTLPYDHKVTLAQINGQSVAEYDPDGLGTVIKNFWNKIFKILK